MSIKTVINIELTPDNLESALYDLYTLMAKSGLAWSEGSDNRYYTASGKKIIRKELDAARKVVYSKLKD